MSFTATFLVNDSSSTRCNCSRRGRNDASHLRYPTGGELGAVVVEVEHDLLVLMRSAEFLSICPCSTSPKCDGTRSRNGPTSDTER